MGWMASAVSQVESTDNLVTPFLSLTRCLVNISIKLYRKCMAYIVQV